jgi:hypothetical protein
MIRISKTQASPMVHVTKADFLGDTQGRKYADVPREYPQLFDQIIAFFDDEDLHQRMVDAQIHHDRPPLCGVVADLEHEAWFDQHMRTTDAHKTTRLRQAIGVLVKVIMEGYGFETTGKKGSLGTRAKVRPGTTTPGAYHNVDGISLWFGGAERYKFADHPHVPVADRAASLRKVGP